MTKMNGTVTISRTPSGNYYASVLFTVENEHYESMNRKDSIGLDFDCNDGYIVLPERTHPDNTHLLSYPEDPEW